MLFLDTPGPRPAALTRVGLRRDVVLGFLRRVVAPHRQGGVRCAGNLVRRRRRVTIAHALLADQLTLLTRMHK